MKIVLLLFCLILIESCSSPTNEFEIDDSATFLKITQNLSTYEFEKIKIFILDHGDKQTYRNLDNNNPHYDFGEFQGYLNAEIGYKNSNNDPLISDFNQITIQDLANNIDYYTLQIVRYGDKLNIDINVLQGMIEGNVYLLNPYEQSMTEMYESLDKYLNRIRDEINKY